MKNCHTNQRSYSSMVENNSHFQMKGQNKQVTPSILIPIHRVQEQIELYNWRTQFKSQVISCQWINIQPFSQKQVVFFLKGTQTLPSLTDIEQVKGCNMAKTVIKIFDSFKLLYDKFGPFSLNAKMIVFDSFYEPLVWMNENYSLNQYKREHISEQEFAENILILLFTHHQKFSLSDFKDQCYLARGMKFNLNQMKQHFIDFNYHSFTDNTISKTNEVQNSFETTLFFKKKSKLKRRQTNPRKDSTSSNITYPPVAIILKSSLTIKKNYSVQSFFKEELKQFSTSSTLPVISNSSDSFLRTPQKNMIDDSFNFEDDLNHFSSFSEINKLSVSVNLEQNEETEFKQEENISTLSKYMRTVVDSVINPQISTSDQ